MFSYFGGKTKLAKYYPDPQYNIIIEPFAGSAQYSLYGERWKKDVLLYDKNIKIVEIWQYLLNASSKDILELPEPLQKSDIRDYQFPCRGARNLIYNLCSGGSCHFGNKTGKYGNVHTSKIRIAKNLYKIKHWQIFHEDYRNIPNLKATWFIDPPYQIMGYRYPIHDIDYSTLLHWSLSRLGEIIICENTQSTWCPNLKPIKLYRGIKNTTVEALLYKNNEI